MSRQTLRAGPWRGVRDTTDPFDDGQGYLVDALNGYMPDPAGRCGFYSRPGFGLANGANALVTSTTPFRGQAIYTHTASDGTNYNFSVMAGKLFRWNSTLSVATIVTPVGVTIDPAITTRVFFASMADNLCVTDGVNRPWLATSLASTPVTGTYIDYDGSGSAWSAQHVTLYGGSFLFALKSVNGTARRNDIAYCEPGLPAIGYQQTGFTNFYSVLQSGSGPITAVVGTNVACYYFRERSIGAISGAIGPNLSSTVTHDAISKNVGTQAPQSIQLFGDTIYFADAIGRPWAFALGSAPNDVTWKNMRAIVDSSTIAYPAITAITTTSAFEPTLNLYLVGIWSPTPSQQASVTELFAYDAATMLYMGRWTIGGGAGVSIDCIGTFIDTTGRGVLMALGSKDPAPATNGYAWSFNSLIGVPDFLTTEGMVFLTTEDGTFLTTEGQTAIWQDNGSVPPISVTTERLGYSEDHLWNADLCTVITTSAAPVQLSVLTPTMATTVECTPTAAASNDGTYRAVGGFDAQGRGLQVTVSPTTADSQWSLQRVSVVAVPSLAGPEDA